MRFLTTISLLSMLPHTLSAAIEAVKMRDASPDPFNYGPDCDWAKKYSGDTWMHCNTTIQYPTFFIQRPGLERTPILSYQISSSGTGQNIPTWCAGILKKIEMTCGKRTIQNVRCVTAYDSFATYALDGDHNWEPVMNPGLQLTFDVAFDSQLGASFSGLDHDHACVADAIELGTCTGINFINGAECVSNGYLAAEVNGQENEGNHGPGPADDPFKDM